MENISIVPFIVPIKRLKRKNKGGLIECYQITVLQVMNQ